MRLLFGCLVTGFILLLSLSVKSQNKLTAVQGRIMLQNNLLADAATIVLIRLRDSSVINAMVAGTNGAFEFHNIQPGLYCIKVSRIGCLEYTSAAFQTGNAALFNLPDMVLMPATTNLKGVTVTNSKAYMEMRPDKTVLNIEKGGMPVGVSVLDILTTAPGVRINSGGDVLYKGGQKAQIAINGRTLTVAGADLSAQLQNLQSGDISQIELIQNPSAKYDAAGAGGVINIILKKGQNDGFNGSLTAGGGYGNFSKLNSNTNLNYRTGHINIFGNYSFRENNTDHTIITNRYVGSSTKFDVNYYNRQKTYGSNYTFGTDYTIDASHTLGLLIVGAFDNNFLDKNTLSVITHNALPDSTLNTVSVLNRHVNTVNYNLNYNGKLGRTSQTLATDIDYSTYNRVSLEDLNSTLYNINTRSMASPQKFRNEAPTHFNNLSVRVDYVNPLSKTQRLEAGLKSVITKSNNMQRFDKITGEVYTPDPFFSSYFKYRDHIASAYANYIATPSKKFDYQLDLRVEHTTSNADLVADKNQVKRNYTDLFPVAIFNYNPTASHQFSFSYSRRIDRPSYQELNPIISFQDKYNFTAGNAYLKPSYQDKIQLQHTYKNKLVTALYASFIRDAYNFTYFSQNDATNVYTTGKMNLQHENIYGITFNAPVTVCKWWDINFDVNASYQHFKDYTGNLDQGTTDAIFTLLQQFHLPADLMITLYGQYEVPTFYAIYHYRSSYTSNITVSKSLFHKRASLNLNVLDVFNTSRDRFSSDYINLNMIGYDKKETQIFRANFTYRFGKSTVKASRKHSTGNADDLKRITGGN